MAPELPRLSAEVEQAIRARVQYCRELGIYDFYRRSGPLERGTAASVTVTVPDLDEGETAVATDTQQEAPVVAGAPAHDENFEEHHIGLRKVMPPAPEIGKLVAPAGRAEALRMIREDIGECTRCPLAFAGRNKIVYGDGDANAKLMFVGEGPGADEDRTGLPFVGKAGQLLNNMIAAMGLRREQVYIANIVKCRPPSNRVPEPEEAHTCTQFLFRQIDVIRPEVIIALGSTAATYLMGAKSPLGALRGRVHPWRDAKLIVTYHPAFLLRDPNQKKAAWADLQIAMAELRLQPPARAR